MGPADGRGADQRGRHAMVSKRPRGARLPRRRANRRDRRPKVEDAEQLRLIGTGLDELERHAHTDRPIALEALIETALGLRGIDTIAAASRAWRRSSSDRPTSPPRSGCRTRTPRHATRPSASPARPWVAGRRGDHRHRRAVPARRRRARPAPLGRARVGARLRRQVGDPSAPGRAAHRALHAGRGRGRARPRSAGRPRRRDPRSGRAGRRDGR